jgi:hypothetical protein
MVAGKKRAVAVMTEGPPEEVETYLGNLTVLGRAPQNSDLGKPPTVVHLGGVVDYHPETLWYRVPRVCRRVARSVHVATADVRRRARWFPCGPVDRHDPSLTELAG